MSFGYREIRNTLLVAMALLPLSQGGPAVAQAACNCSKKLGGCTANVSFGHGNAHIVVGTPQCAQVVYYINGNPSSVTVTGGSEDQDWSAVADGATVSVDSCMICESGDARGVKIDVHPTGRTNPNMNEIHQDTLKLLRDKGS